MLNPKRIFVVIGVLAGLFILAGCSSNPVTPTHPYSPPADNCADVPTECGSDYDGYRHEPNADNPKYDNGEFADQKEPL
jgi:hypothetical protein